MKRREFLRSVAAMPCVAVAGVVAVAPAIHTTGYLQSVNGLQCSLLGLQAKMDGMVSRLGDERRTLERYSAMLKVPYAAIVDPV